MEHVNDFNLLSGDVPCVPTSRGEDAPLNLPYSPVIPRRMLLESSTSNDRESSFRRLSRRISMACRPRFRSSSVNSNQSVNDDDASESSLSLQDFVRSETGWDTTTLNRSEPPVTPSREATEHEHPPTSSAIDLREAVSTYTAERSPNFFARALRAASISRPRSWNINTSHGGNNGVAVEIGATKLNRVNQESLLSHSSTENDSIVNGSASRRFDSSPVRSRARGGLFGNRTSGLGDAQHSRELDDEFGTSCSPKQHRRKLMISLPLPASVVLGLPMREDSAKEKLRKEKLNIAKQAIFAHKPSIPRLELDTAEIQAMLDRHLEMQQRMNEKIKDYHVYIQGATTLKRASMANGATQDAVEAHLKEFREKLSELEYESRVMEPVIRVLKRQLVSKKDHAESV